MVPMLLPAEIAFARSERELVVCRADAVPPPPPEPPYQPWLRGAAALALIPKIPDLTLPPRRPRAPFLFRHPRRLRLAQLLVQRNGLFPFAYGPAPLARRRPLVKLPVLGRMGLLAHGVRSAFEQVSDPEPMGAEELPERPRTRADCVNGIRPCPWALCRHHLYVDVTHGGGLRLNHPGVELEQLAETCALDVADRVQDTKTGQASLNEVAKALGITHERVRQIEVEALEKFAALQAQHRRWAPIRQVVRKISSP